MARGRAVDGGEVADDVDARAVRGLDDVSPWPLSWWLKEATRLPVVMSNAKTLFASTSPAPPTATPGGRARVNSPVTYAVLPTTTESQTTPLTCQVGRPSADTVAGVPGRRCVVSPLALPGNIEEAGMQPGEAGPRGTGGCGDADCGADGLWRCCP